MRNKIDIQNAIALLSEEGYTVTEPFIVADRIEVDFEFINDGHNGAGIYMVTSYKNQIHPNKFPAIKKAIESVLNDTVVEDNKIKEVYSKPVDGSRSANFFKPLI
jgi:hypothetical protein